MSVDLERPQNKIKLLISDLRLGRGRVLEDGRLNQLEEFNYGDRFTEFLQYYSSGAYKDFDVELIINGDFLNFLQVDYKGHYLTTITSEIALTILKSIIAGHESVFKAMGDFLNQNFRKITYIIGNHDQPVMFQSCRDHLDQVIGFPLKYKNSVYIVDGIHIEHGHRHEALNRIDPRKLFIKKNLVEPILNLPIGSHFFIEYILKIKERFPMVGRIRPYNLMIKWAFFNKPKLLFFMTVQFVKYLFNIMFSRETNWVFTKVFKNLIASVFSPDLSQSAKKILADEKVHSVVFGHTHICEYKNWGSDKEYFNTGSWTESVSLDVTSLGKKSKLTYVLFEYIKLDHEPRGRLKEWKGFHRIEEDVVVA